MGNISGHMGGWSKPIKVKERNDAPALRASLVEAQDANSAEAAGVSGITSG